MCEIAERCVTSLWEILCDVKTKVYECWIVGG